jgi:hypothetical protein
MIRASVFAIALFASACTPPENSPPAPPAEPAAEAPAAPMTAAEATAQDTCGASGYRAMVGSNVAAITLPAGLNHRIIAPDSVVTQDFNPQRINFITDANGAITSVECY